MPALAREQVSRARNGNREKRFGLTLRQVEVLRYMFTGLIEEVGCVRWIRATEGGTQLHLAAPLIAADLQSGESVAVNGCCLTATTNCDGHLTFDLLEETIARTNLPALRSESPVNLERALAATGRLGGHFVRGTSIAPRAFWHGRPGAPIIGSRWNCRPVLNTMSPLRDRSPSTALA